MSDTILCTDTDCVLRVVDMNNDMAPMKVWQLQDLSLQV
jgi:hypothetical protein